MCLMRALVINLKNNNFLLVQAKQIQFNSCKREILHEFSRVLHTTPNVFKKKGQFVETSIKDDTPSSNSESAAKVVETEKFLSNTSYNEIKNVPSSIPKVKLYPGFQQSVEEKQQKRNQSSFDADNDTYGKNFK